jgi:hypothetical protein
MVSTVDGAEAMGSRATNQDWQLGYVGNSFYMDGSDSITAADRSDSPFDVTAVMMMAWVHPNTVEMDSGHGVLVSKQGGVYGSSDNTPDWVGSTYFSVYAYQ